MPFCDAGAVTDCIISSNCVSIPGSVSGCEAAAGGGSDTDNDGCGDIDSSDGISINGCWATDTGGGVVVERIDNTCCMHRSIMVGSIAWHRLASNVRDHGVA